MTDRPSLHRPAVPRETNEQALARVVAEQRRIYPEMPCADSGRSCVRRQFPGRLVHAIAGAGLAGAVIGLIVPLVLGAGVGQALLWALSLAVVLGCTLPLAICEDEDGWRARARIHR